jgi:glutathione S-transferase
VLRLYHYPSSVCAQKVRLALAEKRLGWEPVIVDIHAGEQLRPAYLRLNPGGVVPTLDHDGRIVVESTVINEYLQDAFPGGPPLRPDEPARLAAMRLWTKRLDEGLHQACGLLTGAANAGQRAETVRASGMTAAQYLAAIPDEGRRERLRIALEEGVDAPAVLAAVRSFQHALAAMAAVLSRDACLAGAGYSLADAGFTPYLVRLERLGMSDLLDPHPAVRAWMERMRARPNFAAAITAHDRPERLDQLLRGGSAAWSRLKPRLTA